MYFYPYIDRDVEERYDFSYWEGTGIDRWYLDNKLAFKTKEEAIEAANKMIKAIKEEL